MSLGFTDNSTLVQVVAWYSQAASHYLNHCWPRSMLSYGITRPQCVKQISVTCRSWIINWISEIYFTHIYIYIHTLHHDMEYNTYTVVMYIHYSDVIMIMLVSQITSLVIVYSTVYSGTDQRKHQSSASLAFVRGIHQWLVNSSHKGPVTLKMFPFDDAIMNVYTTWLCSHWILCTGAKLMKIVEWKLPSMTPFQFCRLLGQKTHSHPKLVISILQASL